ncbi:hypothetical protein R1sor_012909 [Riccia sorocarpa]|uniref:Uncharacterized protein n=1 Tax=Riccia sorocarpa TaxID=122646 RepID=A0ABD3I570_9MARC
MGGTLLRAVRSKWTWTRADQVDQLAVGWGGAWKVREAAEAGQKAEDVEILSSSGGSRKKGRVLARVKVIEKRSLL